MNPWIHTYTNYRFDPVLKIMELLWSYIHTYIYICMHVRVYVHIYIYRYLSSVTCNYPLQTNWIHQWGAAQPTTQVHSVAYKKIRHNLNRQLESSMLFFRRTKLYSYFDEPSIILEFRLKNSVRPLDCVSKYKWQRS